MSPSAPDQTEGCAEEREKVIVRSNGVVTYVGKDIAYQFWKLGLLGRDFNYREFAAAAGSALGDVEHGWRRGSSAIRRRHASTTSSTCGSRTCRSSSSRRSSPWPSRRGRAIASISLRDGGAVARHGARAGFAPPPDSEDAKRPFVEVSGRKGLGVKADDLLDTVIKKAGDEVAKRNPELERGGRVARTATPIGIAAVRYFLIKFSRGKVIAFDLDEALSFQGESGPYIQYAVVRINNIFRKLQERDGLDEADHRQPGCDAAGELTGDNGHELWSLVLEAARLDEVVEQVVAFARILGAGQIRIRAAQAFNAFYNLHPSRSSILNEERDDARRWRAAAVIYVRDQLTRALDLMGIAVPAARM